MGTYLNPGEDKFRMAIQSKIYVDKSGIIAYLNEVFRTEDRFVCVSRPRRFGKSMAANMIAAYYDRTADVEQEFRELKIGSEPTFSEYLGKYDVIQVNMQVLLSRSETMADLLKLLQKSILWELLDVYPDVRYFDDTDLSRSMSDVYQKTRRPFVIIIDEWDCIFREYQNRKDWQEKYLDFLRLWLKDQAYVGLAYMTGILPIKKCGTHSALNMFWEYTMTNPGKMAEYVGFTAAEVQGLCEKYAVDFHDCQTWYDGYFFSELGEVYNPRSVVAALINGKFDSYWNKTETFEALKIYVEMNFDGLREAVLALMSGARQQLDLNSASRGVDELKSADDVLGMLIQFGYLGYDFDREEVFIPNQEIRQEFATVVEKGDWDIVAKALKAADALLASTLAKDSAAVAQGIENAHLETSHIQYNDENALSYTLSLAYYTARQKYYVVRELPTGKGFADIVMWPRENHLDLPALILELKWDKSANTAIRQIKTKKYPEALKDYTGEILLVGVSYDKQTRVHECEIEEWQKE